MWRIFEGARHRPVAGLAKLRYHLALQLLLILVYLVVAERVVEIVWGFRAH